MVFRLMTMMGVLALHEQHDKTKLEHVKIEDCRTDFVAGRQAVQHCQEVRVILARS